jgi:DNA-binding Lrp family transcriptional regulator
MNTMHPNSLAAYRDDGEQLGQRALQVVAKLRAIGQATDKQLARALGYAHKAAVQPRISELVQAGILEECGSEKDPDTGKTVRVVRVRAMEATQLELPAERDEPDYDAPRPLTAMENWQRNDEHNVR